MDEKEYIQNSLKQMPTGEIVLLPEVVEKFKKEISIQRKTQKQSEFNRREFLKNSFVLAGGLVAIVLTPIQSQAFLGFMMRLGIPAAQAGKLYVGCI